MGLNITSEAPTKNVCWDDYKL